MKDKLELMIVTFNRSKYLRKTLSTLLSENSPVKDLDITVIDNNSVDKTSEVCKEFDEKFDNFKYIKNPYNIGWTDIAQAFFIAKKKYVWVLADDDDFDFTHWNEVETAIEENTDIVCCCHHMFEKEEHKSDLRYLMLELTFLPAGIYKTENFNDALIKNMFENSYTLMPHIIAVVNAINKNLKIKVIEHDLFRPYIREEDEVIDVSYLRGYDENEIYPKSRAMTWLCGFANACSGLNNRKIAESIVDLATIQPFTYGSENNFIKTVTEQFFDMKHWNNLIDIYINLSKRLRKKLLKNFIKTHINYEIHKIKKNRFGLRKNEGIK